MKILLLMLTLALMLSACTNGGSTPRPTTQPGSARNAHGAKQTFTADQR